MTSSKDVITRFSRSAHAMHYLEEWENNSKRAIVVASVLNHVTGTVDHFKPQEILGLCKSIQKDPSRHALRNIKRRDVRNILEIKNWNPAFAFTHLLHFITEQSGGIPFFDEFIRHPIFKQNLYEEIRLIVSRYGQGDAVREQMAKDAVRWRIGLAYYSFIKEQYVFSIMREEGLAVKQHPLADALFRVDCWMGDTNIDLYVGNPEFRSQNHHQGRKIKSANLLHDAIPAFKNQVLECATRHTFGDVHLPDPNEVKAMCRNLFSQP